MLPNLPAHPGQRITEGRPGLVVPGGLPDRQLPTSGVLMRQQRDQGEQRQQGRCGPQDCQVRPLALGLDAQVFADLMQSDFNGLITNDKFCMSRSARLTLTWSRRPRRLGQAAEGGAVYPPNENSHCGGPHETPVASAPATDTRPERAAPMGSGLPIPPAMEPGDRTGDAGDPGSEWHSEAGGVP